MSATGHRVMHQDHVAWQAEIYAWQEELQAWLSEIGQVQESLPALRQALEEHEQALQCRVEQLAKSLQHVNAHEEALADYERGGTAQRLIGMAGEHTSQAGQQAADRAAHEQLKQRHRDFLSRWRRLVKAVPAAHE